MSNIPEIPIVRMGTEYHSLDQVEVRALSDGAAVARVSMGNAGLIRRDAQQFDAARAALLAMPTRERLERSQAAGDLFMNGELPLGEQTQSAQQYIEQLSSTSGLPHNLVRANMNKIHDALTNLPTILAGLSRGLDIPAILDDAVGTHSGMEMSFFPTTNALGLVMPSNSPGVNALWLPSPALGVPIVIKPGREEPWTPWRIMQAMIAAGLPREAFGFYPTDHEGSATVMDVCRRSLIFGGEATVKKYENDASVEVHGPGWSKVMLGEDCADNWRDYVDVIVRSIAANSGRSCINASAIITPRHGAELASAVAEQLAKITPRAADDPDAQLSALANPAVAEWAHQTINERLDTPGATDVTAEARGHAERIAHRAGMTYMLPTLIHCTDTDHALSNTEFMFPFASVVEMPTRDALNWMGPSLVVTAITEEERLIDDLLASRHIQRLNLGPMPTSVAHWDQPHEGNLFDFLYQRRAIQRAQPVGATA